MLDLLPIQADWYCPHGLDDIPKEKIILLNGSVMLGEGVALIATPGNFFNYKYIFS